MRSSWIKIEVLFVFGNLRKLVLLPQGEEGAELLRRLLGDQNAQFLAYIQSFDLPLHQREPETVCSDHPDAVSVGDGEDGVEREASFVVRDGEGCRPQQCR